MATKIKAYKISEDNVKKNRMPAYYELMEGVSFISPIKMRNIASYAYHILEDVKGNIYLIEDDQVMFQKLYERNLGVTETRFMIDGVGLNQIKEYKKTLEEQVPSQEIIEEATVRMVEKDKEAALQKEDNNIELKEDTEQVSEKQGEENE